MLSLLAPLGLRDIPASSDHNDSACEVAGSLAPHRASVGSSLDNPRPEGQDNPEPIEPLRSAVDSVL